MIRVMFDGACTPKNPGGVATWGIVVFKDNKVLHKDHGVAAHPGSHMATCNVAEYTACIKALEYCLKQGYLRVRIVGDSKLVVNQMKGIFSIKSKTLMALTVKAHELAGKFSEIAFRRVPREKNYIADKLTERAYREYVNSNSLPLSFGKYKGSTLMEIAKIDRQYLIWLSRQNIGSSLRWAIIEATLNKILLEISV